MASTMGGACLPFASLIFNHVLGIYAPRRDPIHPNILNLSDLKLVLEVQVSKVLQFFSVPVVVASPPSVSTNIAVA